MAHRAILLVGSNISPEENIPTSIALLGEHCRVLSLSPIWETQAVGSPGPNFLNTAALVETQLGAGEFKWQVLRPLEEKLGRIRTQDKNAPRTIDIDIITWDGQVVDGNLWTRAHIALPVSALAPQLIEPVSGKSLETFAAELRASSHAVPHPEFPLFRNPRD